MSRPSLRIFGTGRRSTRRSRLSRSLQCSACSTIRRRGVYGDSWKKHGELLGIFANITRKYDRLEAALARNATALVDESILDTIADLAVYCTKYLSYLAERHSAAFSTVQARWAPATPLELYQGNAGFGAVSELLGLWQADDAHGDTPVRQDPSFAGHRQGVYGLATPPTGDT